MMMMVGGASGLQVPTFIAGSQHHRSSLLVHPPGLDSLDQTEEVLLALRNQSHDIIQVWEGGSLVLHPVRLQTQRDR